MILMKKSSIYQKLEGEYLFATRTRASLLSEDVGKTE